MPYLEQREFTLRLELRCQFPDDYQGEADGYEWAREVPALTAQLVRAAVEVIGRHPGWKVRPANRGRSSEDEVTLVLERLVDE
ncbi:MAG TPA: hypothetical protein VKN99_13630 [Polyangia bacterium]|nr:hypothetical protein [Polyangia bacterium]